MQAMREISGMDVNSTALGLQWTENSVELKKDGVQEDWEVEKVEKLAAVILIGLLRKCSARFVEIKSFSVTEVATKRILKSKQRRYKNKAKSKKKSKILSKMRENLANSETTVINS